MENKIIKKFILLTFLILLVTFPAISAFAGYLEVPKFLCEMGIEYYEKGDYSNALSSFEKSLLVNPQGETAELARIYIKLIKQQLELEEELLSKERLRPVEEPRPEKAVSARAQAIEQALQEALVREKAKAPAQVFPPAVAAKEVIPEQAVKKAISAVPEKITEPVSPLAIVPAQQEVVSPEVLGEKLVLDETVRATQPSTEIELEKNQAFIIEGREIARWLVTSPEIIAVERQDLDQIKVTAEKVGATYLHIWDQNGRWTLNIRVIPPRYIKRIIERYRKKTEEAEPFKFRYSFSRNSFHSGPSPSSLARETLSFDQWLSLTGETPYGDFDTSTRIRKLRKTTNLSYFTMGLTDGSVWGFEDFDLRAFDYSAGFSELTFPGQSLRGIRLDKEALDNRLSYTALWGKEDRGKFGRLSPALAESRDAYLFGGELSFQPTDALNYSISSFWGYGDEREEYLRDNIIGLEMDYDFNEDISFGGSIGYDSQSIGLLLHSKVALPSLNLTAEFREIEKDFLTITGRPSRLGEIGAIFTAEYFPRDWINLSGAFDIYRDRLFPNPDDPDRLNLDLHTASHFTINPTTSMTLDYQYVDEQGKAFPRRANSFGLGIVKRFPDLKDLTTHLRYGYRDSKNPKTPTADYNVNSLTTGLSLKLVGDLSYYVSRRMSWLTEEYSNEKNQPSVWETGLDYSTQIFTSPFYTTLRFNYRNEEDAASAHSFLAGEDSLQFFGEISYRPSPDLELFVSSRLKNIWPEDEEAKRAELELKVGGRLLWDTGIHWNPLGSIAGLVYKDLNDDAEQQDNEPGVEAVRLFVGEKEASTDIDGFYMFSGVRGKKATVKIDASSLPTGFVISGPSFREVQIKQGEVVPVDFRLISRSEIYGVVFEDVDADGKFGPADLGIARVKLSLEDGRVALTDRKGQYYFRRATAGEHTITLDINSLSLDYLPAVPLTKKITLFEGITYIHNIPCRREQ